MQTILNFLKILLAVIIVVFVGTASTILALLSSVIVTAAVLNSYVVRRYEVENRLGGALAEFGARSVFGRISAIAGEMAGVLICFVLYPFGYIFGDPARAKLRKGERPLIFCHGYMHNRSAYFVLGRKLRRIGWNNIVLPNFRPAAASIPDFAEHLADTVRLAMSRTGSDKVDLVGHSMGGLVVRHFMERLAGAKHVNTAVTLGTPHRGTKAAALGLFKTARQFRPDSPLMRELNELPPSEEKVKMVSIWSEFDSVVLPPENALLPEPHVNVMIPNVGHVAMLFSGRVFEQLRLALSQSRTP